MRKFLVGACCVIVGLQFAAVVAAVLVLAVLAAVGGVRLPQAFQSGGAPTYYSDTLVPTPASPSVSPAVQSAGWEVPAAAIPAARAAPDPMVESILEYREQVGSPLAGTILADDPASPADKREITTILAEVSAENPAPEISAPEQTPIPAIDSEPPTVAEPVALPTESSSPLATAVDHLYRQAARHETLGEYERADQLRELARQLRREWVTNGDGGVAAGPAICPAPPPPEAVVPANPAELPAADADSPESAIPAS